VVEPSDCWLNVSRSIVAQPVSVMIIMDKNV
jgi:hypothetical protein